MLLLVKRIKHLLSVKEKNKFIVLAILLTVGMFLEIFSISWVFLSVDLISNNSSSDHYDNVISAMNFLSLNNENLILFVLISLIIIYTLKNSYLIFLTYYQNSFIANFSASINSKLYSIYIRKPYSFHIERDIGEIVKNLQVELNHFIVVCNSFIQLIIEISLSLSILFTLFYIAPLGSVTIGIMFTALSLFYLGLTRTKLSVWGTERRDISTINSNLLLESLNAIKELKIFNMESHFIKLYSKQQNQIIPYSKNFNTISQSPRFFLEVISILGMGFFVIIYLRMNYNFTELLPLIGVCVASVFRIIPSVNRIIGAIQNLKYYSPSIEVIISEFENFNFESDINIEPNQNFNFKQILEFKNVDFEYFDGQKIFKSLNLKIKKGTFIGIHGKSGSGKTTFLNLICGLIQPSSGSIVIDEIDMSKNLLAWKNNIGYVSQEIILLNDTILNNIVFGQEKINYKKINKILKDTQLNEFINSLKYGLDTNVGERAVKISGGQRQRIGIARALYKEPSLLILDEATSSLDPETTSEFMKSIKKLRNQITIIFVTHQHELLQDCDFIYKLKNKKLFIEKC